MEKLFLETFGPLVFALLLLALVLSGKRLLHQLRNRMTPEQAQAARDAFRNRLVHPNAAAVEEALGALLPERLLTLYRDHPTVLTEKIEIRRAADESQDSAEWIEAFLPLDLETQRLTMHAGQPALGKGFCFATDGAGSFYCVPASAVRRRTRQCSLHATAPRPTSRSRTRWTNCFRGRVRCTRKRILQRRPRPWITMREAQGPYDKAHAHAVS